MTLRISLSRTLLAGGCSIAAFLATGTAMAQQDVASQAATDTAGEGEIIVTAQRRSERLEAVPVAITAVTGDTLAKSGIVRFQDLGNIAPGVQVSRSGAFTQPSIRGVTTLTTGQGYENNVAVYVDGFFQSDTVAINGDLVNVSDVQVLKGPQGTLYGRNATAGAILITTKAPSDTFTGEAQVSYGRFDDFRAQAYVSGPIAEGVSFSLAGYHRRSDGYIRDFGGYDAAPVENDTVRAKLQIEATDNLKFVLGYNYGRILDARALVYTIYDKAPSTLLQPPARATERNTSSSTRAPDTTSITHNGTLTATLDTEIGTLTSYTGYVEKKQQTRFDFDGTPADLSDSDQPGRQKTFQQSFDFSIDYFDWADIVVGASYLYDKYTYENQARSNGGYVRTTHAGQISRAMATYVDATFHLTDKLFFTAGGRYSTESKDGRYYDTDGNTPPPASAPLLQLVRKRASFQAFTPRGVLRYQIADRTNVYASVSQGFRTGTFPVSSFPNPDLYNPIQPERITAYEVGFKTASSQFRFDAAAYYYDYKNLQVGLTVPNPLNPATVVQQVINANKAEVYGAEASGSYSPISDLTLRAGVSWTHARYKDFANATGTGLNPVTNTNVAGQAQNWSGQEMARAPAWSGNAGFNYRTDLAGGKIALSGNASYTSSFVLSNPSLYGSLAPAAIQNQQRYRQGAYALVNAQIAWTDPSDHFTVTVYGDNLTNTKYMIVSSGGAFGDYRQYGEPTAYGVRVGYKF